MSQNTGERPPTAPASFTHSRAGDGDPTLAVRGEIDVYTSPDFRRELYALIDRGASRVVVDFGAVDFIDSSGLGVLVGALKRIRERDGEIAVRDLNPSARKVFEITGLNTLFHVEDAADAAGDEPTR